jgi:hypothetical protein
MVSLMRLTLNWNDDDDDDAAADDGNLSKRWTTAIEIRIRRHQRGNVDDNDSDAGAAATMSMPTTMLLWPILSPAERVVRAAGRDYTTC